MKDATAIMMFQETILEMIRGPNKQENCPDFQHRPRFNSPSTFALSSGESFRSISSELNLCRPIL